MMLGFIPLSFRFRGRQKRLMEIYFCFIDQPGTGLHPTQISRRTGISLAEVQTRLENTPELFVKLPRRPDGITRYRLTSATTAKTDEQVAGEVNRGARRESLLLYAVGTMVACLLLIVVVLVGPAV